MKIPCTGKTQSRTGRITSDEHPQGQGRQFFRKAVCFLLTMCLFFMCLGLLLNMLIFFSRHDPDIRISAGDDGAYEICVNSFVYQSRQMEDGTFRTAQVFTISDDGRYSEPVLCSVSRSADIRRFLHLISHRKGLTVRMQESGMYSNVYEITVNDLLFRVRRDADGTFSVLH